MPVNHEAGFRFRPAFTIPLGLIILVAVPTWIIPAGLYQRRLSKAVGKDVAVAGSHAPTGATAQGVFDMILALIAGTTIPWPIPPMPSTYRFSSGSSAAPSG